MSYRCSHCATELQPDAQGMMHGEKCGHCRTYTEFTAAEQVQWLLERADAEDTERALKLT